MICFKARLAAVSLSTPYFALAFGLLSPILRRLELVVLNLVINARDAMRDCGSVTIETANAKVGPPDQPEEPPAGDYVMIAVKRHRFGNDKRSAGKSLRAVFHDQGNRQGLRLGIEPGARLREAIKRRNADRYPRRRGHVNKGLFAAGIARFGVGGAGRNDRLRFRQAKKRDNFVGR